MSENFVLQANLRDQIGTGSARELRRQGLVPATLYGNKKENISFAIEEKEITKLYRKHGFTTSVIELNLGKKKVKVLPKSVQLHPVKEFVIHADFVYLNEKGTQKVSVPVVYEGKERSIGVKRGGFFNTILRKVTLNCPVNAIPTDIKVNVSHMSVGSSIRSKDITLPEGCEFASKKVLVLASITGRGSKSTGEATEETAESA